jgi:hypothetical protein
MDYGFWMVDWRSSFALCGYGVMSPPSRFAATAGQGKANFGFYFDILLDFGLAPPTVDSFRTWKPISFLGGREAGVTNG